METFFKSKATAPPTGKTSTTRKGPRSKMAPERELLRTRNLLVGLLARQECTAQERVLGAESKVKSFPPFLLSGLSGQPSVIS